MKRLAPFVMFSFLCALSVGADELKDYKGIYNTNRKSIHATHKAGVAELAADHDEQLAIRMAKASSQGRPDLVDHIKEQRIKFDKDREFPTTYADLLDELDAERDRAELDLSKKYLAALRRLAVKLLKAGDQAAAEKVKKEHKKVEFIVADLEARDPLQKLLKGLVLHYDFAENERDHISDRSGNANDATVIGATWRTLSDGRKGVLKFDGENQWVLCERRERFPMSEITMALWFRPDKEKKVCLLRWNDGENENAPGTHMYLNAWEQRIGVDLGKFGPRRDLFAAEDAPQPQKWNHVLFVFREMDRKTRLYLNGKLIKEAAANRPGPDTNRTHLFIGGMPWTDHYLDGQLDDVMVWDRALSEAEAKSIYELTGSK